MAEGRYQPVRYSWPNLYVPAPALEPSFVGLRRFLQQRWQSSYLRAKLTPSLYACNVLAYIGFRGGILSPIPIPPTSTFSFEPTDLLPSLLHIHSLITLSNHLRQSLDSSSPSFSSAMYDPGTRLWRSTYLPPPRQRSSQRRRSLDPN